MKARFTDYDDNIRSDFIPRKYFKPITQVGIYYVLSLILIVLALRFQEQLGGSIFTIIIIAILLFVAAAITYFKLQQSNDLIMENEFQNLLFAAASSLGSQFCFYLRHDGTIVYANDGTRQMFPKFAHDQSRALDALLDEGDVSEEDRKTLFSALTKGKKETIVFEIRSGKGEIKEFVVTIDPLKRPSGYFVVHGRTFTKNRTHTSKLPGKLGNTKGDKVETLLDNLPLGVYITSDTGVIEYANITLEKALGYHNSHLYNEGVTIQNLVYHADGYETGEFEPVQFSGNVLLSKLNGSLLQAQLDQYPCYDKDNTMLGYIGVLNTVG